MANFFDMLFGSKDKIKNYQQYNPQQMQAMQQMFQALMGQGGGGGEGGDNAFGDIFGQFDPSQVTDMFQKGVQEPAMRNFQQSVIPGIKESFADQGASSGLNNSLATAGSNLQSDLGSQLAMFMQQAKMQNQQNRIGGLNSFMNQRPNMPYQQRGQAGVIPSMLEQFANGAGRGAMGMFG